MDKKGTPGMAYDGQNLKVPFKKEVNAGRVIKTPPKPTGSGTSKSK